MRKPSPSVTDKLAFHGKKSLFAGWKDKIKAHLTARSDALVVTELQSRRQVPVARYEDALLRKPVVQDLGANRSDEGLIAHELQKAFVRHQASYIKDLLNLTLLAGFADERLMQRPVHEIWRAVEKRYGLNTASGVVELVEIFERIVNSDFKSVAHLVQQLKAARDQANRNSSEALRTGSAIMFTPEEFTTECVETKLTVIFGGKSRAEINALAKGMHVNDVDAAPTKPKGGALGKRKAFNGPDMHSNLGIMSRRVRSDHYEPTPKTKGKGKFQAERKEMPTEDCLPKGVPCKAVQAKQPASSVLSLTPPSGTFDAMDTDEPMELFDIAANHGDVNAPGIVADQAMQTTAQELDQMAMELEDMDAGSA
ncbi:hypothetical protein PI124_g22504 [Phytophthora idaei]|nr:hypothetical protein PI124_g22504 [Phytophthora idaei]